MSANVSTLHESTSNEEYTRLLEGRKIVRAEIAKSDNEYWDYPYVQGELELDDGTLLEIAPNQGGCACSAGDYSLDFVSTIDNVITRAELFTINDGDEYEEAHTYKLFVFADNTAINVMTISGDDGNGYYGTGFEITVKVSEQ